MEKKTTCPAARNLEILCTYERSETPEILQMFHNDLYICVS